MNPSVKIASVLACAAAASAVHAASIAVPDFSFESPNVTGVEPYYEQYPNDVAGVSGAWEKYGGFHATVEAGRYGVSPAGLVGTQFGNITGESGGGMFQDTAPYDGSGAPDLYWQEGVTYTLTIGVFFRSDNIPGPDRNLDVRFFYRDADQAAPGVLASRTLVSGADPITENALTDFTLTHTVAPGAPEAGRPIGLWFTTGAGGTGPTGDWGIDNVRLDAVPEPSAVLLGLIGLTITVVRRRR